MPKSPLSKRDLLTFVAHYDQDREAAALSVRQTFLAKFPLRSLSTMTLAEYVTGMGRPTFCNLVESGTKAWANIQGATSSKFGIYYGRIKSWSQIPLEVTIKGGNLQGLLVPIFDG